MALWGKPGAMIDGMYTITTDDLTVWGETLEGANFGKMTRKTSLVE